MTLPYRDAALPVHRRVDDLLGRMTLEDKAGLLFHTVTAPGDLAAPHPFLQTPSAQSLVVERHMTHFNLLGAAPDGRAFARWHNELQRLAADQPLGIPVTLSTDPRHHFMDNPLSSMVAGPFSQWPEPLGLAAIGSEDLIGEFADIARQEYTAVGIRVGLHPQVDLATEPRWGRISGTFGEDAALSTRVAIAYVRGFQGDSLGPGSVAMMAKHFPGGGPQKDGTDPHFSYGREQVYPGNHFAYHLEPFRALIAAGVAQIMPYYGMPVGTTYDEVGFSFNRSVITGILREELGFDGVVCTDWGLVTDNTDLDHLIELMPALADLAKARAWGVEHLDTEDRLLKILDAGVDQFGGEECPDIVVELVRYGRLAEARVDESARRLLREKFVLGLFDAPYVDEGHAAAVVGCAEFRDAGRRAQQASVTLLTNREGTGAPALPLTAGLKVYVEGASAECVERHATVVTDPADADVALLRLKAPSEPGVMIQHGTLEFTPGEIERITTICDHVPTVIDIYLDRPAVLTPFVAPAAAITANFGIDEAALLDVLFGHARPQGNLPFDLPRSMAAVVASRSDVPFDTEDPVFRFGHGLRYVTT